MKGSGQGEATEPRQPLEEAAAVGDGSITSLRDLFLDQLRDIYSVECQLVPALAELELLGSSPALRQELQHHVGQTRRQKERLERIGGTHGWDLGGDPSKAMEGLIDGGRTHVVQVDFPPARDFLIIAHTHRIKHYELAAYTVIVTLAERLNLHGDAKLLGASMQEEQVMDRSLAHLAASELFDKIPAQ